MNENCDSDCSGLEEIVIPHDSDYQEQILRNSSLSDLKQVVVNNHHQTCK